MFLIVYKRLETDFTLMIYSAFLPFGEQVPEFFDATGKAGA